MSEKEQQQIRNDQYTDTDRIFTLPNILSILRLLMSMRKTVSVVRSVNMPSAWPQVHFALGKSRFHTVWVGRSVKLPVSRRSRQGLRNVMRICLVLNILCRAAGDAGKENLAIFLSP